MDCEILQTSQRTSINRPSELKSPCDCIVCTDFGKSNHPTKVEGSTVLQQEKQSKSYSRKIQTAWHKKYPWITVCSVHHRIFCRLCCSVKQHSLLTRPDRYSKSSFLNGGFTNWKKAMQKFSEHECNDTHCEATERLAAKKLKCAYRSYYK